MRETVDDEPQMCATRPRTLLSRFLVRRDLGIAKFACVSDAMARIKGWYYSRLFHNRQARDVLCYPPALIIERTALRNEHLQVILIGRLIPPILALIPVMRTAYRDVIRQRPIAPDRSIIGDVLRHILFRFITIDIGVHDGEIIAVKVLGRLVDIARRAIYIRKGLECRVGRIDHHVLIGDPVERQPEDLLFCSSVDEASCWKSAGYNWANTSFGYVALPPADFACPA